MNILYLCFWFFIQADDNAINFTTLCVVRIICVSAQGFTTGKMPPIYP